MGEIKSSGHPTRNFLKELLWRENLKEFEGNRAHFFIISLICLRIRCLKRQCENIYRQTDKLSYQKLISLYFLYVQVRKKKKANK